MNIEQIKSCIMNLALMKFSLLPRGLKHTQVVLLLFFANNRAYFYKHHPLLLTMKQYVINLSLCTVIEQRRNPLGLTT